MLYALDILSNITGTEEMEFPGNEGNMSSRRNGSDPFGRNEEVAKIEITVLSLAFIAAVVGNVSVLLAMSRSRRKLSRMHLFMRHLSLADLVVAFFQVLPQLCWEITFRFYGPDFLCRIVKHLQTVQQPTQRAYTMIGGTWACSLVLSSPQYFIFSLSEVRPGSAVYDCWAHFIEPWGGRAYISWITAGIFVFPVAVLVLCYGLICFTIWKNLKHKTCRKSVGAVVEATKSGLLGRNSVSSVSTISRAKLRTVKMTFVIVVAYVVCWAPFFTVQMWSVWDKNFSWAESENTAVTLSALLASLNSCCNPWIYMIFSGHLLSDFARGLPCCKKLSSKFSYLDSDSSFRRTTQLSRLQTPRMSEPFKDTDITPKTTIPVPTPS